MASSLQRLNIFANLHREMVTNMAIDTDESYDQAQHLARRLLTYGDLPLSIRARTHQILAYGDQDYVWHARNAVNIAKLLVKRLERGEKDPLLVRGGEETMLEEMQRQLYMAEDELAESHPGDLRGHDPEACPECRSAGVAYGEEEAEDGNIATGPEDKSGGVDGEHQADGDKNLAADDVPDLAGSSVSSMDEPMEPATPKHVRVKIDPEEHNRDPSDIIILLSHNH